MSSSARVKQAIFNYMQYSDIKPSKVQKSKNKKPEKEVEKQVLDWCKKNGLLVFVVESKATFSKQAGRYINGQAQSGFSDIVGLNNAGQFLAIELKAPGRRTSLRPEQFLFLQSVIQSGGFAAVVVSVEILSEVYSKFLQTNDLLKRVAILLSFLPIPKVLRDQSAPLFDE